MRRLSAIVIVLCLLYFIGGWIAVQVGLFESQKYYAFAGIVGGLASVSGLLSFTRPAITSDDLQRLELESLKSVTKTSEELESLKQKRSQTAEEITSLESQKKEMELLVKKASLSLFLTEQCDYYEKQIFSKVSKDESLKEQIENYRDAKEKLDVLGEEIKSHPNADLLSEIIDSSKTNNIDITISELNPGTRALYLLVRELGRSTRNIFDAISIK